MDRPNRHGAAAPPIAFFVTYRFCLGLRRSDREVLEHGIETGIPRGGDSRAAGTRTLIWLRLGILSAAELNSLDHEKYRADDEVAPQGQHAQFRSGGPHDRFEQRQRRHPPLHLCLSPDVRGQSGDYAAAPVEPPHANCCDDASDDQRYP